MEAQFRTKVEAQFRTKCAVCGEWIEEGDEVVNLSDYEDEEEGWVHEDCADGR